MKRNIKVYILIGFMSLNTFSAFAQEELKREKSPEELAKELANPVASLISVPFQNNLDVGIGEFNGSQNTLNFQPVVPFSLSKKLNLITRMIMPIVSLKNITGQNESQTFLATTFVSAFLSPTEVKNGLIWGAGLAFSLPTATFDTLGKDQWGVGPTAVVLKQTDDLWTFGLLVHQIWSVINNSNKPDANLMFIQPFIVKNWKSGAGLGISGEILENWENTKKTTGFINLYGTGITKFGKQIVNLVVGPRIGIIAPEGSKPDFGIRAALVFIFPK